MKVFSYLSWLVWLALDSEATAAVPSPRERKKSVVIYPRSSRKIDLETLGGAEIGIKCSGVSTGRFGSQAAGQHHIRRTAGFERLPAVQTESRSKVGFERLLLTRAVVQVT